MSSLPQSARELIESGALGHLVTVGADGAPHVTIVWVGVDGDDLLTAHLNPGLAQARERAPRPARRPVVRGP